MSWFSPSTWDEIVQSVTSGFSFHARRHGVAGETILVLSDVRRVLSGHLDDFAREIIASNDRTRAAYMATGSRDYGSGDFVYVVTRDGNAIAGVTAGRDVVLNPMVSRSVRRYRDAIERLTPALASLAANHRFGGLE